MKRYELLALVLLVSHAFSASVPEAELEEDEPVEGFDLSSDGAFGSQHQTRIQTDDFLLEHNSNFDLDHVFAESRVGPGPFQILVHDLVSTFGNFFWIFLLFYFFPGWSRWWRCGWNCRRTWHSWWYLFHGWYFWANFQRIWSFKRCCSTCHYGLQYTCWCHRRCREFLVSN